MYPVTNKRCSRFIFARKWIQIDRKFYIEIWPPRNESVSFYESNLISHRFFIGLGLAQKNIYIRIQLLSELDCCVYRILVCSRTPVAKVLELLIFYAASLDANSFSFRDEQNVGSTRYKYETIM